LEQASLLEKRGLLPLIKSTFSAWRRHNASLLAAGLSYFTVFSLTPLIMIAIAIFGLVFGKQAAEGEIVVQLSRFVGSDIAQTIQMLINNARHSGVGKATAFSMLMLVLGASAIFGQLQKVLNMIWGVEPAAGGGIRQFLKNYLLLFVMVAGVGVLLLLFFVINAALGIFQRYFGNYLPILDNVYVWKTLNSTAQFGAVTLLSAIIYKFLPDTRIAWRDVWIGALVTSLLLTIEMSTIGLYFSHSDFKSIYGVAASVVIIFIWVYLSAQIFLLGAEFTWAYANTRGSKSRHSST
jgi:membrane protein